MGDNLKYENRIFLMMTAFVFAFYVIILIFLPSIKDAFLAEFFAGFLGILIAFYLDRQIGLRKKAKTSKQIINSLLVELSYDLNLVKKFQSEIKIPTHHRISPSSPHGSGIDVFDLFQTNAWNIFSSRLELGAVEILYDLATIYHRLELFNEAMKIESIGERRLSTLLKRKPKFLGELEKDLEGIIERLDSSRI